MSKRKPKFYMKPLEVLIGTSIMVRHDKEGKYKKAPLEVFKKATEDYPEVLLNRLKFIPFERNTKLTIEKDLLTHKSKVEVICENEFKDFGTYTLDKVIKTSKIIENY